MSLYIDLLKKILLDVIYADVQENPTIKSPGPYDRELRLQGRDFPRYGHTMMGLERLNNLEFCVNDVITNDIPGDFIECGVWRGGAIIFMLAMLKELHIRDRIVWAADSFQGLPQPSNPLDKRGYGNYPLDALQVSLQQVKENIAQYDLLNDQVGFLQGWFGETLPDAPIEKIAILRADGDLYESTMDILNNLYPKLSIGGYCIIDDYGALAQCGTAVREFWEKHNIDPDRACNWIDWAGIYWQKTEEIDV